MEEAAHLQKHNSLSKDPQISSTPKPQDSSTNDDAACLEHSAHHTHEIAQNVDQFIHSLAAIEDKSSDSPQVPDYIESFSKIIESRISKYNSGEINTKFGKVTEDDLYFIHSVRRISELTNALSEFPPESSANPSVHHTSAALQRAMVFLEEEFRALLEDSRNDADAENAQNMHKWSSFNSKNQQDYCELEDSGQSEEYPPYSLEMVTKMHEIAAAMISSGYETECCQVYYISRRNAIRKQMAKLDFEIMWNMDDVAKAAWETLEAEISRWIRVVKACSETIFPGEKRLAESVFADYPLVCRSLLNNIVRGVVIQLLDFAEATAMAKRSAEKLFKYLDMYEALQNLIPIISGESCWNELTDEVYDAVDRIGESAVSNFCDLENSIKGDAARTPVPGGAVHPLTRYVMNYLKYTCDYKDTLEKIFEKHTELGKIFPDSNNVSTPDLEKESESPRNFETMAGATAFSVQVVTVMDLLDGNLERKSKLYRDPSLRNIFLMNNGRYILQKVKGASEIVELMGDTWCRRRSTVVRQYHKNYQQGTWNRVLQTLSHEGLVVNGKANKTVLKERFKIFSTTFEEICRTQSMWVVSDEQLQSELRISVSAVLIPAYRAFVGRFRQYMDSSKHADKYIKYQPEDIETMIEKLFEGNSNSMQRRK